MGNWFTKKITSFVKNPMSYVLPGFNANMEFLGSADNQLQKYGLDLFGNGQQEKNNKIAEENNQLQREAFEFNKNLSTDTYDTNKDLAYNAQQVRSADMAKAGLNPLAGVNSSPASVSSTSVSAPSLQQPENITTSKFDQAMQVAQMAISAKQVGSQIKAQNEQARYQELVNDYFEKYKVLPTQQNEWIAQAIPLFQKISDKIGNLKMPEMPNIGQMIDEYKSAQTAKKVESQVQKIETKRQDNIQKGKNDLAKGKHTVNSAKVYASKFPKNEKGWLDYKETSAGKDLIKVYGWNSARQWFFDNDF